MTFKLGSALKSAWSRTNEYLNEPLDDGLTRADHLQKIGKVLAEPDWTGAVHEAGDFLPPVARLPGSRGGGVGGVGGGQRRWWRS